MTTMTTSRDQLEFMVKDEAARLNSGWTYAQNFDGDYIDENGDATSPYEVVSGALDIEYEVSRDLEYRGAKIYTAIGGPTVWIEVSYPGTGYVRGIWGYDEFSAPFADGGSLNEAAEEIYQMTLEYR